MKDGLCQKQLYKYIFFLHKMYTLAPKNVYMHVTENTSLGTKLYLYHHTVLKPNNPVQSPLYTTQSTTKS